MASHRLGAESKNPPSTDEKSPEAVFWSPPATDAAAPLARLTSPPLTVDSSPDAVFWRPPSTVCCPLVEHAPFTETAGPATFSHPPSTVANVPSARL